MVARSPNFCLAYDARLALEVEGYHHISF
jgi:hypothetical protein